MRDSSNSSIALRTRRSSPPAYIETIAWIRVSPMYWSCSQYGRVHVRLVRVQPRRAPADVEDLAERGIARLERRAQLEGERAECGADVRDDERVVAVFTVISTYLNVRHHSVRKARSRPPSGRKRSRRPVTTLPSTSLRLPFSPLLPLGMRRVQRLGVGQRDRGAAAA
jgi:hypothetical protein